MLIIHFVLQSPSRRKGVPFALAISLVLTSKCWEPDDWGHSAAFSTWKLRWLRWHSFLGGIGDGMLICFLVVFSLICAYLISAGIIFSGWLVTASRFSICASRTPSILFRVYFIQVMLPEYSLPNNKPGFLRQVALPLANTNQPLSQPSTNHRRSRD